MSTLKFYCNIPSIIYIKEKFDINKVKHIEFYENEKDQKPYVALGLYDSSQQTYVLPAATVGYLKLHKGLKDRAGNVGTCMISNLGTSGGNESLVLPSVPVLNLLAGSIAKGHKLKSTATHHDTMLFCMALFTFYQEFSTKISEYLLSPDENIEFDENLGLTDGSEFLSRTGIFAEIDEAKTPLVPLPKYKIRAIIYLTLYGKDKGFTSTTHAETTCTNRIRTLNALLHVQLQDNHSILPYSSKIYETLHNAFDPYPKLKTALYHAVKLCEDAEMNNLYKLMEWNQLNAFKLGWDWFKGPKSYLHINRAILDQLKKMYKDYNDISKKTNGEVGYYRYLYPGSTLADLTKYPDVIAAGTKKYFAGKEENRSRYKSKVSHTIIGFDRLFEKELPIKANKLVDEDMPEEEKRGFEELLGLNMDEITKLEEEKTTQNMGQGGLFDFFNLTVTEAVKQALAKK